MDKIVIPSVVVIYESWGLSNLATMISGLNKLLGVERLSGEVAAMLSIIWCLTYDNII